MNKIRVCGFNAFCLSMIYAGFKQVGQWWSYRQVMSPFYRLYYIERGRATVCVNDREYELTPGTLFLIPKFTLHSYACADFMDHYYICFFDDMAVGSALGNPLELQLQVEARTGDLALIQRYLALNPHQSLPVVDPQSYDNKQTLYEPPEACASFELGDSMEGSGILLQLFSRFIAPGGQAIAGVGTAAAPLRAVVSYIHKHLDQRLSVTELAELMHCTPDHFAKIFKRVMGITPCAYIQLKRIERAQALLLSSDMSMIQIAERIGVLNHAQFTRLFTKIAGCSPKVYRAQQQRAVKDRSFDADSTTDPRLVCEADPRGLADN